MTNQRVVKRIRREVRRELRGSTTRVDFRPLQALSFWKRVKWYFKIFNILFLKGGSNGGSND